MRSVFHLLEYKEGHNGHPMTLETFLYIFDELLMLIAMVVMNMCHPAKILRDGKHGSQQCSDVIQLS